MPNMRIWLYNGFFVAGLPVLLWLWAAHAKVNLPPPPNMLALPLMIVGGFLLLSSIATFMVATGKAPSNADTPGLRVTTGPYSVFSDPIYIGFALLAFGAAAQLGSAGGFWLVAPSVSLGAAALVFGHETRLRPALADERRRSLLSLPAASEDAPSLRQRAAASLQVLGWIATLIVVEIAATEGADIDLLWLFLAAIVPFSPRLSSARTLRRSLIAFHVAMTGIALFAAGPAPMLPMDAALTSFFAAVLAFNLGGETHRTSWGAAIQIAFVATVATVAWHAPIALDIRAPLLGFGVAGTALPAHRLMLALSEGIANSWGAIRLGPVRILNYAAFAFLGAASGAVIYLSVVGDGGTTSVVVIAAAVILSAAVWGQLVEFSGKLARPFGYYGALAGAFMGVGLVTLILGVSPWLMGAGLALGAPLIQSIGRLRCLVQGCCHGAPTHTPDAGITYRRPHSRVLRIANLGGQPIHPTPLYSIYSNLACAVVLVRMLMTSATQTQIIAVYLVLSGGLRFIEEGWRGEPQTPVWAGLKLYQWLAICQSLAGVAISFAVSPVMPQLAPPDAAGFVMSVAVGLLAALAMGVDFPGSASRFSRLTPGDADTPPS